MKNSWTWFCHVFISFKTVQDNVLCKVPTQSGKMGRLFPVREKSGNFQQTGKVHTNYC